ncbi:MAG: hypothetical protein COV02_00740 [Candidatus Terrybacteria bacterium CG10_big_fil_rev_8_21_14_0_10_41_10]|uniref:Bifunctional protein FolD n=1 Tax=Candidatus Terrybacteria bacterium CG10_big_fil_rev_8_21_14_0_10_41_10 TaxID=1975026 RepID=A0A2M8LAY2_9BACT|nr:MAG: hypothetical protein COV02_00740 [Candidatus Terrybacteria bacterium CG10_big_fil_rev_8_21_14_0_10_41_10]
MIIDGKKIAGEIKQKLKEKISQSNKKICLAVVQVGENDVSERFVKMKKKFADEIGVETDIIKLPKGVSKEDLKIKIKSICADKNISGVIVQLPLPESLRQAQKEILDNILPEKDIDVLSSFSQKNFKEGNSVILPPVTGAVKVILEKIGLNAKDLALKNIVIFGRGSLVGKPVSVWLESVGARAVIVDKQTINPKEKTITADIIISGVGAPGIITSDMVKEGVIIVDAGTSEQGGKLAGDMTPDVGEKASFFTPVPGGVGPVTVAILFENLIMLAEKE